MRKSISVILLIFLISTVLSSILVIKNKVLSEPKQNNSLAIMVYDDNTSSYVKQNNVPIGNYTLNTEKTNCIAGGTVSDYNSTEGTLLFSLNNSDQCYIYFDKAKAMPTFTLSSDSITKDYYAYTTQQITYSYNGDGTLTCSPATGSYSTCSINPANKTITFTRKALGKENFTITASEGVNYLEVQKIVSVEWTCLDPETLIAYWDKKKKKKSKKKIKDFEPGDIVYSYNEQNGEFVTRKVKAVTTNKTKEIYHIFVDGDEIKTTATHPIYVNGAGYLNASMLKEGVELIGSDGKLHIVERVEVEVLETEIEMYCLELEDNGSSFAVGNIGIICLAMFVDGMATLFLNPLKVCASGGSI